MLLNLLAKEEKHRFMDLLFNVISADGPTSETEKKIIDKFKYEMGEDALRYRHGPMQLDKLIEYFEAKPDTTKNLVFYNLLSASLSDDFYSVEEHIVMSQIQEGLGVSQKKRMELMKAVYAERDLREKVKRVISEWEFKGLKMKNQLFI